MAINTSPMFRSMYPNKQDSALTGLLLGGDNDAPQASPPAPMPAAPPPAMANWMDGAAGSPSRAQLLNRPAQSQYAKTPAPAAQPQSVWRSPSSGTMNYRQPTNPTVTAGLLDGPSGSVAANYGQEIMPDPGVQPLPGVAPVAMEDRPPPMPQVEMLARGGNDALPPQRVPDFLDLLAYQPLQPTRRYEVL